MKTKYLIVFEVSLEKMLPSVGQTIDEVNKYMGDFGFNETVTLRSELPLELTTSRPMTPEEENLLLQTTVNQMQLLRPEWKPTLKSFSKLP